MEKLRQILVGVDFDLESEALTAGSHVAARRALWLGGRTGARVDFLHSTGDGPESGRSLANELPGWARNAIDGLLAEHGAGVESGGLAHSSERSWVALIRRVVEGQGDMVFVAKRNQSRHDDRKLGSVSMKLVRMCPAPVWVVKPDHEQEHRSVLAATDLTPVGDRAVEYGGFVAQVDECSLGVVHALQLPMEVHMLQGEERQQREKELVDGALAHIRAMSVVGELGKRAQIFVGRDTPSHAITAVSDKIDPDLVVMGTISRGGIAGMLVGNTAERLLYQLDCSILTVKPEDFGCPLNLEEMS